LFSAFFATDLNIMEFFHVCDTHLKFLSIFLLLSHLKGPSHPGALGGDGGDVDYAAGSFNWLLNTFSPLEAAVTDWNLVRSSALTVPERKHFESCRQSGCLMLRRCGAT